MGYPIDTLRTLLLEKKLDFREKPIGGAPWICWFLGGSAGTYQILAYDKPCGYLMIYVVAPIRISEARRARVAELIAHLNYGGSWGTFELDPDDGELRFRSSGFVPKGEGGKAVVAELYKNRWWMDRFFELIVEAMVATEPVAVALRRLSSAMRDGSEEKKPAPDVGALLGSVEELARKPLGETGGE